MKIERYGIDANVEEGGDLCHPRTLGKPAAMLPKCLPYDPGSGATYFYLAKVL